MSPTTTHRFLYYSYSFFLLLIHFLLFIAPSIIAADTRLFHTFRVYATIADTLFKTLQLISYIPVRLEQSVKVNAFLYVAALSTERLSYS